MLRLAKRRPTKRAPDAGDSAHIPSSFTRLSIFPVGRLRRPHPSAGNANRWAFSWIILTLHKNGQLMFGIPYRHITINTPLNPAAISQCFQDIVWEHSPIVWFGETPTDKKLVGKWSFEGFQIQKISGVHKSMHNPVFYGKIYSISSGSKIDITITLSVIDFLMLLVVNIVTLFFLIELSLNKIESIVPFIIVASFLGIFNYIGYWIFKLESEEIEFEICKKLLPTDSSKNDAEANMLAPYG